MIKIIKKIPKETFLLISLILFIFVLPLVEGDFFKRFVFSISYSIVLISIFLIIDKRSNFSYLLLIVNLLLVWASAFINGNIINYITFILSVFTSLFSGVILINHILKSKTVDVRLVIETISGYLLIGVILYFLNLMVFIHNNNAFNLPSNDLVSRELMYYSFITLSTIGYGEITPISSIARSLSIFFGIAGQLYLALIVAFIIGKFSNNKK